MKKIFNFFFIFSLITATHAQEFKVVLADYKPYSWMSKNKIATGIEIDILKEAIEKRMGIPVSIKIQPWKRAQQSVKAGIFDAFIAVPNPKRKSYTKINTEVLAYWGVSVFANANNPKIEKIKNIKNINELKSFKLGSMIGNAWAEKNMKDMQVQWVVSMKQLLLLLQTQRIDVVADNPAVMNYHIKEMDLYNKITEFNSFLSLPFHLGIGNKSTYLWILPEFDKTINEMKNDGTMKKIIDKYKLP